MCNLNKMCDETMEEDVFEGMAFDRVRKDPENSHKTDLVLGSCDLINTKVSDTFRSNKPWNLSNLTKAMAWEPIKPNQTLGL